MIRWFAVAAALCASGTAQAATWEEWSNTDVSAFWELPGGAPAQSRVGTTPSGDAQFSIPVQLPDARLVPPLSISYAAQGGDDPHLGTGWHLGLPVIVENLTPFAVERFSGPDGPLVTSGPRTFLALEDPTGHRHSYRFDQVVGSGALIWNAWGPDGQQWEYHRRVGNRWLVTKHTDRFGNVVVYDYDASGRILTMTYGGAVGRGGHYVEPPDVTVSFEYEARLCARSDLRAGTVNDSRLAAIDVATGGETVRSIAFAYQDECPDRLAVVEEVGTDLATGLSNSRSWQFEYGSPAAFSTEVWSALPGALGQSTTAYDPGMYLTGTATTMQVGSGNGDPLPDVLDQAGIAWGQTVLGGPFPSHAFDDDVGDWGSTGGSALGLTLPGGGRDAITRTVDFDSDGFEDVLISGANGVRFLWGGSEGLWTSESSAPWPDGARVPLSASRKHLTFDYRQYVRQTADLVDWNGDGYLDLVHQVGNALSVALWNPIDQVWEQARITPAPWCLDSMWAAAGGCGLKLSETERERAGNWESVGHVTASLMDLNGDRLPDMVIAPGEDDWRVYVNTGHGFSAPIYVPGRLPEAILGTRESWTLDDAGEGSGDAWTYLSPGDVDADGLVDFVWIDGGFAHVFRNTGDLAVGFEQIDVLAPVDVLGLTRTERSIASGGAEECATEEESCAESCDDDFCVELCEADAANCLADTTYEDVSTTLVEARDWNGDGALDVMDLRTGEVHVGAWPGPSLLTQIQFEAGSTTLGWRSASENYPSGDFTEDQENHLGVPTLRTVQESDDNTKAEWTVTHDFSFGRWDPDRRRFLGFGQEVVDDTTGHRSTYQRYTEVPYTGFAYDVSHGGGRRGAVLLRIQTVPEIVVEGTGWYVVRPVEETVTQTSGSVERKKKATYIYDDHGNLERLRLHGEDRGPHTDPLGFDDTLVEFEYAESASGRVEPCVIRTGGVAKLGNAIRVLQERRIEYDDQEPCVVGDAITAVESDRIGNAIIDDEVRRFEIERNRFGQPTLVTSPGLATTTYTYDPTFRFADTITNDAGHVTLNELDVWGRARRTTTSTGVVTETERDGFGRPVAVYRSSPSVARHQLSTASYDDANQSATRITWLTDTVSDAEATEYYDSWGAVIQTRTALPTGYLVADTAFHPNGKVAKVGVPRLGEGQAFDGGFDTYTTEEHEALSYDDIGRWLSSIDPLGGTSDELSTDPWSSVIADSEGFENHKEFDAQGRVKSAWAEHGPEVLPGATYVYDVIGRLESVTDPDGVTTTYTWSSLGELLRVESPDFGWREYGYDADGYLTDTYDSAGRHVRYVRDGIGRVLQREEGVDEDLDVVEVFHWDAQKPGLLDAVDDAAGRVDYTYDGLGRLITESRRYPDAVLATRKLAWDNLDRLISETNPDGVRLAWFFARGRASGFEATLVNGQLAGAGFRYDEQGRYDGFEFDHGELQPYHDLTRDLLGRIKVSDWQVPLPNASVMQQTHTYGYLANGLMRSRNVGKGQTTFGYDPAGRIDTASGHGGSSFWDFSPGGTPSARKSGSENKTFVTEDGSHRVEDVYSAIGEHWSYSYGPAGNVFRIDKLKPNGTLKERVALFYDALGRPVFAASDTSGAVMRRSYAHDGSVAYEEVDGKAIRRMGSWERVGDEDRTTARFGGEILGRWVKGKHYELVVTDLQGTPTHIVDRKGKVLQSLDLDVYGAEISPDGKLDPAMGWLGVASSKKLDLSSTGARLFDGRSRAFLSPDPLAVGLAGIELSKDPYMSNPYAYARYNGASLSDRNGLCPTKDFECPPELSNGAQYALAPVWAPDQDVTLGAKDSGPPQFVPTPPETVVLILVAQADALSTSAYAPEATTVAGPQWQEDLVFVNQVAMAAPIVSAGAGLARAAVGEGIAASRTAPTLLYRGLAAGEDISAGLVPRAGGSGNSAISHVAGKIESGWISTTKDSGVARGKYGEHGVVAIDASKLTGEILDLSGGISNGGRMSSWAIADREVLIRGAPADAIWRIK